MISREAAEAIAQALLEPAHAELRERRNARVRYSLVFHRFPELGQFEPWQRDVIARRCATLVNQQPLTFVLFALWVALAIATVFFLPERFFGIDRGPVLVVAGFLLIAFHTVRVRRYVRAFVAFVEEQKKSPK
jgi:hypothetical protein